MANELKITGLKKRQQIAKANKTVFLWVAGAAVILSFGIVAGQVLVSQAMFNQKVISQKSETAQTLSSNIEEAKKLKSNVNLLLANQNLSRAKSSDEDTNLKVVLDALPTANEPLAFGSSLQLILLPRTGANVEGLSIGGVDTAEVAAAAATEGTPGGPGQIEFDFTVNGNIDQIRNVFNVLENSIRPISVSTATIEGSDRNLKLVVTGHTYYNEAKTVELKKEVVKP